MTELGDWDYVNRMWKSDKWIFIHGLIIYFMGQGILIFVIVWQEFRSPSEPCPFQFSLRTLLTAVTACGIVLAIAVPSGIFRYALDAARLQQTFMKEL
jgi:hypothetical protein